MHKSVTFELPPTFEIPPTCQGTKDRRIGRLRRRSTEYATYGSQSRGWSGRPEMRTFDITEANDNCLPLQLSGSESSSPDQVSSHTSDKALAGDLFISADATMRTLDEGDWTSFARSHYPRSYKSHQSTHPGITFCPDCKCPTIHEPPSVVAISGVCDNRKWQWIGEPPFCCVCASRRGLGKLSHFGCVKCKERRSKFFKRAGWFNRETCKHCNTPRSAHSGDKNCKYPSCPTEVDDGA